MIDLDQAIDQSYQEASGAESVALALSQGLQHVVRPFVHTTIILSTMTSLRRLMVQGGCTPSSSKSLDTSSPHCSTARAVASHQDLSLRSAPLA